MSEAVDFAAAVRGADGAVQLWLRVQPGSKRSQVLGMYGDRLRVSLAAPPVDGKANAALVAWLAELFDLPRAKLRLVSGEASRDKRVEVAAPLALVRGRLEAAHGMG